jgi:ribosomal protein L11 methyltransferase
MALLDSQFRERLLKHPGDTVASYGLDRTEETLQNALKTGKLETIIGSMLSHKLLPHRVGRSFIVLPFSTKLAVDEDLIPIWIDQWNSGESIGDDGMSNRGGRAFGSGLHPSTYLCLNALEDHFDGSLYVLDIGTGSGILAIAAAKLGASRVLAIDIDEGAVKIAQSNVKMNEVDHIIAVEEKTMDQIGELKFDLILANIVSSLHLSMLRDGMLNLLSSGGRLILSGIKDSEQNNIRSAIGSAGGLVMNGHVERGWVALVVRPAN